MNREEYLKALQDIAEYEKQNPEPIIETPVIEDQFKDLFPSQYTYEDPDPDKWIDARVQKPTFHKDNILSTHVIVKCSSGRIIKDACLFYSNGTITSYGATGDEYSDDVIAWQPLGEKRYRKKGCRRCDINNTCDKPE